jgi:hypothetical protein
MEELIDMIAREESPSEVSNAIKSLLMQKSMERIETVRPPVVSRMFDLESPVGQEEEE